jgi:hypothetical protein
LHSAKLDFTSVKDIISRITEEKCIEVKVSNLIREVNQIEDMKLVIYIRPKAWQIRMRQLEGIRPDYEAAQALDAIQNALVNIRRGQSYVRVYRVTLHRQNLNLDRDSIVDCVRSKMGGPRPPQMSLH